MNIIKRIILPMIILTLPVSIFFISWSYNTLNLYFTFDKFSFITGKGDRLYRIGLAEYYDLKYKTLSIVGINKESEFNFLIQPGSLNNLNDNLPQSGTEDENAYMSNNSTLTKGKLRYRGDNFYHWIYPQKSWRFKTSKKDLFHGVRKLNYIIPKGNALLNNHMSYELAHLLGLLSPRTSLTNISINNVYNGIKLKAEQIDESFLRKNRRMPNDVYKGDNMGQKSYKGVKVSIFNNPSIWEKASYNNHYDKLSVEPLKVMVDDINNNRYAIYDLKHFASIASFIDMTATYHYDSQHNWILYYDNYYEKMYPIIWDPVGWWPAWVQKDNLNIITSDLLHSLYLNYDFLRMKYNTINHYYINNNDLFSNSLVTSSNKAKRYINGNGYTFGMGRKYLNLEDSIKSVDNFSQSVQKRLSKVEEYFIGSIDPLDYKYFTNKNLLRLQIGGSKLVKKIIIESKESLRHIIKLRLSIIQNGKIEKINIKDNITYLADNIIQVDISLLPKIYFSPIENGKWKKAVYQPATYDIEIEGVTLDIKTLSLSTVGSKNKAFKVSKVDFIKQIEFDKEFNNILKPLVEAKKIIWSTNKNFSGFNIIKDNIIIKPGTKIIFDQNATLKVLGKVTAIGTKDNPIIFEAKDKTKPWNALALKDAKANGSVFKHCIFKDGSGDKGDLYEYTAMFSVHNVKDLLVENCEFYDSHRTDDMVHVIYSDVTFKNTKFVRSLSDALDIDISNAIIDNCEFIDSGNDSIDLMTTNAIVTNTRFYNSIDKAISIGEGSNLLAVNNYIKGSEIGMQSKDTSKAYIYNTSFIGNKKAVDAYHKNWRYSEGGTITLDKCVFENNIVNATVGKKSKVIINSSNIDTPNKFDANSIRKKKIIISDDGFIKYNLKEPLFKDKIHLISKDRRGYHE